MRLDLSNIGGIRLVPYGATTPTTYGYATSGHDAHTPSRRGYVSLNRRTVSGVQYGILVPGASDPSKPILDIGGRVYLAGAKIIDTAAPTFRDGGYLGTISASWRVRYYSDDTRSTLVSDETVSLQALAIIPSTYSGGVRVDNLTLPGAALQPVPTPTTPPAQAGWADAATTNGTTASVINYLAQGCVYNPDGRFVLDWLVPAIIGIDFYYELNATPS